MGYQNDGFGKIQYKAIGKTEGEEILKKMDKYSRPKVKSLLGMLSGQPKSLAKFHKYIKDSAGRKVASKFEEAAEKHYGGGVTEVQRKRNVASTKEIDDSFLQEQQDAGRKKINYSALGDVGKRDKGTASDIGIKRAKVGFASGSPQQSGFAGRSGKTSFPPAKIGGTSPIIPLQR